MTEQPQTAERPRTWADVAYLAVCLFGGAAILLALSHCSLQIQFRDPHEGVTNAR